MADTVHHEIHKGDGGASAMTAIVAILAIVVIVGIALYTLQIYPFDAQAETDTTPNVQIDIKTPVPNTNPSDPR